MSFSMEKLDGTFTKKIIIFILSSISLIIVMRYHYKKVKKKVHEILRTPKKLPQRCNTFRFYTTVRSIKINY